MDEIVTDRAGSILRVQLNRPTKKNAMTSGMYVTLADIFNDAAQDERTRVVLWHGAGGSFCAGNALEDFLRNPPGAGESPQVRLINELMDFDKPVLAAMHGAAIGGRRDSQSPGPAELTRASGSGGAPSASAPRPRSEAPPWRTPACRPGCW